MKKTLLMLAPLALGAVATSAAAQGLDGKSPMICAAASSVVCSRQSHCVAGPPEEVNLPVFWRIDPAAKVARSTRQGGEERTSTITSVSSSGGQLILQGSDEGLGWSVSIDQTSGRMVLTGGRELAFVVFGNCTTP